MADFVVVGGGSAGCALAAKLSEDVSVSVVLIEAGGDTNHVLVDCPAGLAGLAMTGQGRPGCSLLGWVRRGLARPGQAWSSQG